MTAPPRNDTQRSALMTAASDARGKGDRKAAIDAYLKILAESDDDPEVHGKVAQLLAESDEHQKAWVHYQRGAEGFHQKGFTDRAIALYKQGTASVPHEVTGWLRIAELYVVRLKKAEAVKTLLDARARYAKKRDLEAARTLLWKVIEIAPNHVAAVLDLARVLKRLRRRDVARSLLEELVGVAPPEERKRVRRALFFVAPTPASWWRWVTNKAP